MAKRVLRYCPNLVELRMPDATIRAKLLGDIIRMCPMIEIIETCVLVWGHDIAPTPIYIEGKFVEDSQGISENDNAGSAPSTERSIDDILRSLLYEDRLLLHSLSYEKEIFRLLRQCQERFTSLTVAVIVENRRSPIAIAQKPACDLKYILGGLRAMLPMMKFIQLQAMIRKTKVFFKFT
ncbi:uncharacterized protein LOC108676678 [Hyalella azteca]|uniref:Uncharacterized protein LOC108676678 n=1 Tax=Hyalella azteca TaxID=294128 RepID=A0A8B7P5C4_HYAAZ|nr:uncharacterized protein LOC108676678 [Hyalella azteca]